MKVGLRCDAGRSIGVGHLIRADDEGLIVVDRHGARLRFGETAGGGRGWLAGERRFVDVGRLDGEGQTKAREQFAAIPRRRREHEGSQGILRCFCWHF